MIDEQLLCRGLKLSVLVGDRWQKLAHKFAKHELLPISSQERLQGFLLLI